MVTCVGERVHDDVSVPCHGWQVLFIGTTIHVGLVKQEQLVTLEPSSQNSKKKGGATPP